jgi:hypothetical protein
MNSIKKIKLVSIGIVALGLFVIIINFSVDRNLVKSSSDIVNINGIISNYVFDTKKNHFDYYLQIEGFNNKFQVRDTNNFNRIAFSKNLSIGDSINIGIPSKQNNLLNKSDDIIIFSLYDNNDKYMSEQKNIDDYITISKSNLLLYFGLGLIIIGAFIYYDNR